MATFRPGRAFTMGGAKWKRIEVKPLTGKATRPQKYFGPAVAMGMEALRSASGVAKGAVKTADRYARWATKMYAKHPMPRFQFGTESGKYKRAFAQTKLRSNTLQWASKTIRARAGKAAAGFKTPASRRWAREHIAVLHRPTGQLISKKKLTRANLSVRVQRAIAKVEAAKARTGGTRRSARPKVHKVRDQSAAAHKAWATMRANGTR